MRLQLHSSYSPFPSQIQQRTFCSQDWMTLSSPEQSGRWLSQSEVCKQESVQEIWSVVIPSAEILQQLYSPFPSQIQWSNFCSQDWMTRPALGKQLSQSGVCKQEIVCQWFLHGQDLSSWQLLTFSFTDPVEELLLTELDTFISRVSFGEVPELVYSVPSENVSTCRDLIKMYFCSNYLHRSSRGPFGHRTD